MKLIQRSVIPFLLVASLCKTLAAMEYLENVCEQPRYSALLIIQDIKEIGKTGQNSYLKSDMLIDSSLFQALKAECPDVIKKFVIGINRINNILAKEKPKVLQNWVLQYDLEDANIEIGRSPIGRF